MKINLTVLLLLAFINVQANPDDFIITIKTDGYGASNVKQFTIPTNPLETYNYSVDCENDGIVDATGLTGNYTCNYNEVGQYVVRIIHDVASGNGFPSIQFSNPDSVFTGEVFDSDKLVSIDQWGTAKWTNMSHAFQNTSNLYITATDIPDFSSVQDMSYMFMYSKRENLNTTFWDVSNVTNMEDMFVYPPSVDAPKTTPDLSMWDTSSVVNMSEMFRNVQDTSDISQWDTSKVTDMSYMFSGVNSIADISQWNTSSVTDMSGMFSSVHDLILEMPNWDTSKVTNMEFMFASSYSLVVNSLNWNTSSVTQMNHMFDFSRDISINTSNWDTSSVSTIEDMFAFAMNIDLDTSLWNLSSLNRMDRMLMYAINVSIDLSQWRLSSMYSMQDAFTNFYLPAEQYELFLINLNTYNSHPSLQLVTRYSQYCSTEAEEARLALINRGWSINDAGKYCQSSNIDDFIITIEGDSFEILTNSNFSYNYDVDCNNDGVLEAQSVVHNYTCDYSTLGGYDNHVIAIKHDTNTGLGFPAINFNSGYQNLDKIKLLNQWGTSKWQSMESALSFMNGMFIINNDIPNFSEVTNFSHMFDHTPLIHIDVSQWITSSATDMSYMFNDACPIKLDVTNWDTSSVVDMSHMFSTGRLGCVFNGMSFDSNYSVDVSQWDTSAVIDMSYLFSNSGISNPDVSQWDTSSVQNMSSLFSGTSIDNIDLSLWNTSSVTNMQSMFAAARGSSLNISNWDTSAVTSMYDMFYLASFFSLDVSQWDTSSVISMQSMFARMNVNDFNIGSWNIANVEVMNDMFQNYKLARPIYESILENFASQMVNQTVGFGAGDSNYCSQSAINARNNLINVNGWVINDAGFNCVTKGDFVISVKTDNSGVSSDLQFTIPINPNVNGYNYSVDCDSDGVFEAEFINTSFTCNYTKSGIYKIRIVHDALTKLGFPSIYFNNSGDVLKLLTIEQWGDGIWTDMKNAFLGASNLDLKAHDFPDFSMVVDMTNIFNGVVIPNHIYEEFMINLRKTVITQNIDFHGGLNIYCSEEARASRNYLIQQLGWQINDGGWQCYRAPTEDFLISIVNNGSASFNIENIPPDLSAFDFNIDCDNDGVLEYSHVQQGGVLCENSNYGFGLHAQTIRIEHNLPENKGLPYFSTSGDINAVIQWGTGKWESMSYFFADSRDVWVTEDIPDTTELVSTAGMFSNAENIQIDVSNWDLSAVSTMKNMFRSARDIMLDTSSWNTSSVQDMSSMFNTARNVNLDITHWDTTNVSDISDLFFYATDVNVDISNWKISNVTNMNNMYRGISLPMHIYDDILIGFGSQNVNQALTLDVGDTQYCSLMSIQSRANLINNYNWIITDGGYCGFVFKDGFEN